MHYACDFNIELLEMAIFFCATAILFDHDFKGKNVHT